MDAKDNRADAAAKVRSQFSRGDALFGLSQNLPKLVELRLELIRFNPNQPRKSFDEDSLAELAASIERHGLIQPITVQRLTDGDGYVIVAGERRFRAFQHLGRETIPAIVTTGNADEIALIENLQREDLKPIEEAEALARLMEIHQYNQEQLAQVVGKKRNTVNEILRLTTLPDEIKAECRTSDTPPKSVLIQIARLADPEEQRRAWVKIRGGATVRQTRAIKEQHAAEEPQTPTARMLTAGRSFVRRLSRLPEQDVLANRDQYQELIKLRTAIDELIAKLEKAQR